MNMEDLESRIGYCEVCDKAVIALPEPASGTCPHCFNHLYKVASMNAVSDARRALEDAKSNITIEGIESAKTQQFLVELKGILLDSDLQPGDRLQRVVSRITNVLDAEGSEARCEAMSVAFRITYGGYSIETQPIKGWVYENPEAKPPVGYSNGARRPDERASWSPVYSEEIVRPMLEALRQYILICERYRTNVERLMKHTTTLTEANEQYFQAFSGLKQRLGVAEGGLVSSAIEDVLLERDKWREIFDTIKEQPEAKLAFDLVTLKGWVRSLAEVVDQAMEICDAIPTKLYEHEDPSIARIGQLVRVDGGYYTSIRGAQALFRSEELKKFLV